MYEITYAGTVEEGAALVSRLRGLESRSGSRVFGFDTEFYGVQVGRESPYARAKVHFASLAWGERRDHIHPRGYPVPSAAVLSREVVTECAEFRRFLEGAPLVAHNAPVDIHTCKNEGIELKNVVNTLTMARWAWPGRARAQYGGGGFTLDALGRDVLGEAKTESFTELFRERVEEWSVRRMVEKCCACGEPGCRKRVKPDHEKWERATEIREPKIVEREVPLESVVPGHPLFERALKYSAQDAVLAYALWHILTRELTSQTREVPWIPKSLVV
jgi:hypothetical protein